MRKHSLLLSGDRVIGQRADKPLSATLAFTHKALPLLSVGGYVLEHPGGQY